MNKALTVLSAEQVQDVSGGHSTLSILGGIITVLELPHIFMGLKEFTNYAIDMYQSGGQYEEGDHFSKFFVNSYQYVFGKNA